MSNPPSKEPYKGDPSRLQSHRSTAKPVVYQDRNASPAGYHPHDTIKSPEELVKLASEPAYSPPSEDGPQENPSKDKDESNHDLDPQHEDRVASLHVFLEGVDIGQRPAGFVEAALPDFKGLSPGSSVAVYSTDGELPARKGATNATGSIQRGIPTGTGASDLPRSDAGGQHRGTSTGVSSTSDDIPVVMQISHRRRHDMKGSLSPPSEVATSIADDRRPPTARRASPGSISSNSDDTAVATSDDPYAGMWEYVSAEDVGGIDEEAVDHAMRQPRTRRRVTSSRRR